MSNGDSSSNGPPLKFHSDIVRGGNLAAALNRIMEADRQVFNIFQEKVGDVGPDVYQYVVISVEPLRVEAPPQVLPHQHLQPPGVEPPLKIHPAGGFRVEDLPPS